MEQQAVAKEWRAPSPRAGPPVPAVFGIITEGLPLLVKGLLTQSPVQMLIV